MATFGSQPSDCPAQKGRSKKVWDSKSYDALKATIGAIPPGDFSRAALDRIRSLDCANPDKTVAPCDPTEPKATEWALNAPGDAQACAGVGTKKVGLQGGRSGAVFIARQGLPVAPL